MQHRDSEPGYRWVIVFVAAAILAVAMGQLVNGLSVLFVPLEVEFAWPRGSIALINSAGLIGLALGGIAMGSLADRANIRNVCLFGAVVVGVCVYLASWAETHIWDVLCGIGPRVPRVYLEQGGRTVSSRFI